MIHTLRGLGVLASGLLFYAMIFVGAFYGISMVLYFLNLGFETFVPDFWQGIKTGSYFEFKDFNDAPIYSEERWEQHEVEKQKWNE